MNLIAYRTLVDCVYTEEEVSFLIDSFQFVTMTTSFALLFSHILCVQVRKMCEDLEVTDGPNDEGEMFERPAKLSDKFVRPYKNEAVQHLLLFV